MHTAEVQIRAAWRTSCWRWHIYHIIHTVRIVPVNRLPHVVVPQIICKVSVSKQKGNAHEQCRRMHARPHDKALPWTVRTDRLACAKAPDYHMCVAKFHYHDSNANLFRLTYVLMKVIRSVQCRYVHVLWCMYFRSFGVAFMLPCSALGMTSNMWWVRYPSIFNATRRLSVPVLPNPVVALSSHHIVVPWSHFSRSLRVADSNLYVLLHIWATTEQCSSSKHTFHLLR